MSKKEKAFELKSGEMRIVPMKPDCLREFLAKKEEEANQSQQGEEKEHKTISGVRLDEEQEEEESQFGTATEDIDKLLRDASDAILLSNVDAAEKLFAEQDPNYLFLTVWEVFVKRDDYPEEKVGRLFFHSVPTLGKSSLSFEIFEKFRNKGYGSDLLRMITMWAFRQKDMYEVVVEIADENAAANHALENARFVYRTKQHHVETYSITKPPLYLKGIYLIMGVWLGFILSFFGNNMLFGFAAGVIIGITAGVLAESGERKHRNEVMGSQLKDNH